MKTNNSATPIDSRAEAVKNARYLLERVATLCGEFANCARELSQELTRFAGELSEQPQPEQPQPEQPQPEQPQPEQPQPEQPQPSPAELANRIREKITGIIAATRSADVVGVVSAYVSARGANNLGELSADEQLEVWRTLCEKYGN